MKYRNQEKRCPLCGEERELFWGDMELQDESVSYGCFCRSCGASWTAWYSIVYDENTNVVDGDGNDID